MEVLKLLRGYHRQCRLGVASETPCYGHCHAINDVFKSVMNEVFVTQYMYTYIINLMLSQFCLWDDRIHLGV